MASTVLVASSLLLSVSGLLAQDPRPTLNAEVAQLGVGAGLQADEGGGLLGLGTDYKVHFGADGFVFVPLLGKVAPHDLPLAMVVSHTGRGELAPVGKAVREQHNLAVDYVRPQLRERLEVRPEGCKQSFVFTQLPPGQGDLVVRVQITTELQPHAIATNGSMRWTAPGVGGVEIGQVVGIDGAGRRTFGSMRCNGDALDFVLPAEFVANAALPLVLDPLIGAVLVVTNTADDDRDAEAAYLGATTLRFLVVWRRFVSATNHDIRGQLLTNTNVLGGGVIGIESSTADAGAPRVAESIAAGFWIAVWEQGGDIRGSRILSNGLPSPFVVAATANTETTPDIVGGGTADMLVVWNDTTANAIEGSRVLAILTPPTVSPAGTFATGSTFVRLSSPAVPPSVPGVDVLLTYVGENTLIGARGVTGVLTTKAGLVGGTSFPIAGGAFNPACAGDGDVWVVAYETTGLLGEGMSCVSVRVRGAVVEVATPRLLTGIGVSSANPSVAWLRSSALVVYTRPNGALHDVVLTSIDPFLCADCEGTIVVDAAGNDNEVGITSTAIHPGLEQALIVWASVSGGEGNISTQRFVPTDGIDVSQVGGCTTGRVRGPCSLVGNANFGFQLLDAAPGQFAFAVVSTAQLLLACGPCVIVPDSAAGITVFLGNTTPVGGARVSVPLPNIAGLSGLNLFAQFAMLGNQCFSAVDLTEAVHVTLQ